MAWNLLRTDYTDAVWDGLKKYSEVNNPDGTVSFRDVTVYTNKEKSFFGAKDANCINGALNYIMSMFDFENAGSHNAVYRGKHLGNFVTQEQYEVISSGKFTDLYIGDYWTIADVNYRIAAFDYYLNCGDIKTSKHHIVIVPDTCLYNHVMNDTNVTTGGYVGSKIYKQGLTQAKTTIKAAFNSHVLSHRVLLTNAVANGKPSNAAWCDSEIELMSEEMVYGGGIFRPTSDGVNSPANNQVEKSQFPLFAHEPNKIANGTSYWLRDIVNNALFANVREKGDANCNGASNSFGVRPVFCIS